MRSRVVNREREPRSVFGSAQRWDEPLVDASCSSGRGGRRSVGRRLVGELHLGLNEAEVCFIELRLCGLG